MEHQDQRWCETLQCKFREWNILGRDQSATSPWAVLDRFAVDTGLALMGVIQVAGVDRATANLPGPS
jgi:hypothetical protein